MVDSAMYFYNPKTLIHATMAARTIEVGEEITIPCMAEVLLSFQCLTLPDTDINIMQARAERQKVLSRHWGFKCSCELCSSPDHISDASDSRLTRIEALQTDLADYSPWSSTATPAMAEELIALYAEEGLYAAKAIGHTFAALAYNAVGNTKIAEWHADLALDAGVVNNGSPDEDAKAMKLLLENPVAHWSYKVRAPRDEL
jgi:hypothetical protein